jgi:hypothetical protein
MTEDEKKRVAHEEGVKGYMRECDEWNKKNSLRKP